MDLGWYRESYTQLVNFIAACVDEHEVTPPTEGSYRFPDAMFFMWSPFQEQSEEENWDHIELSEPTLVDLFSVLPDPDGAFAEVAIHVDDTVSLLDLAIIDTMYGILVQEAARNKSRGPGLDIPMLNIIGSAPCIAEAIRWRQHIGFLLDEEGMKLICSNGSWINQVERMAGRSIFEFLEAIRCLYPIGNVNLIYREDDKEFVAEGLLNNDCYYSRQYGWWRLFCLLGEAGYRGDWTGGRASVPFDAGFDVLTAMTTFFRDIVTDPVFVNLTALSEWHHIFCEEYQCNKKRIPQSS